MKPDKEPAPNNTGRLGRGCSPDTDSPMANRMSTPKSTPRVSSLAATLSTVTPMRAPGTWPMIGHFTGAQ